MPNGLCTDAEQSLLFSILDARCQHVYSQGATHCIAETAHSGFLRGVCIVRLSGWYPYTHQQELGTREAIFCRYPSPLSCVLLAISDASDWLILGHV